VLDDTALTGGDSLDVGQYTDGDNIYKWSGVDGTNTYKMVGNNLKINDSLTVKDFHNGDNKIASRFSYKLYKKSA
jgi:hypothetical protein